MLAAAEIWYDDSSGCGALLVRDKWAIGLRFGSHHADFALFPVATAEGARFMAAVPMSTVKIERTWDVAGMKGTGSDTLVLDDVVLPADHFVSEEDLYDRSPDDERGYPREASLYWVRWVFLRSKMFGVLVGIAEGLLEQIIAGASRALPDFMYNRKSDWGSYVAQIGECVAKIDAARSLMERATDLLDDHASAGRQLTLEERARCRGDGAVAVEILSYAVDQLMFLAGSSAFADANPAQRFWRDYSIAARHTIFSRELSYEVCGRHVLGLPNVVEDENV